MYNSSLLISFFFFLEARNFISEIICCWFYVFFQGAIESVSASEIKLSVRKSLVKLGVGFLPGDRENRKLGVVQVLICDLEVVMRSSTSTESIPKAKSHKSRTSGRGKWLMVANIARFLSVSVADMVVKVIHFDFTKILNFDCS